MPIRPPALLVAGPPASGKTVLGKAIARHLGAALLDLDVLTRPLTAVVGSLLDTDDLDSTRLADATRDARYDTLYDTAADNLAVGNAVVLVAPFTSERRSPDAWDAVASGLSDAGGLPMLVWLRVTPELLRSRMSGRAAERDQDKLANLDAYLGRVDLHPPSVDHVAVDAASPVAAQVRAVLDAVERTHP
ncbi:AAA family ATPase [Asanoa iriomotensis]|uniref:Shikimate kinase n=1 Tax=Asanoa iriomotensis TaxID=234613 RepID=A0ABQ4CDD8_9ACTN|nr:AAA family ATPase [Asanoa iriomotensis]GIF60786.1 hypothetical protein Air01nite_68810 [Asanoa iriomotensis]